MALKAKDVPLLKDKLDALARTYHDAYLATDPLGIAHAYQGERNREVVAFLSASLAFGNAAAIRVSVKRIMERLGPEPAAALRRCRPGRTSASSRASTTAGWGPRPSGSSPRRSAPRSGTRARWKPCFSKAIARRGDDPGGAQAIQGPPAPLPPHESCERKNRARHPLPPPRPGERQRVQAVSPVSPVDDTARRRSRSGSVENTENASAHHTARHPYRAHRASFGTHRQEDARPQDGARDHEKPEAHRPRRPGALRFRHLADGYSQALSEQAKRAPLRRLPSSGRLPLLAASSPKKKRRRDAGARMNGGGGCRCTYPGIPCHPD